MPDNEPFQNLMIELRRGSLTLAVLGCLETTYYGYALLQSLKDKGINIEANTLYPLLRRLEDQGLLVSDWNTSENRPRKYYSISDTGKTVYHQLMEEWDKIQNSINTICRKDGHNE